MSWEWKSGKERVGRKERNETDAPAANPKICFNLVCSQTMLLLSV